MTNAQMIPDVKQPIESPMKLMEALRILKPVSAEARPFAVDLVCGFTPLHLETFLAAHMQLLLPGEQRVTMQTGIYGDLAGSLQRLEKSTAAAAALLIEWSDFDPRLGIRHLGGWGSEHFDDILDHSRRKAAEWMDSFQHISSSIPLAVSMPTLPLPPIASTSSAQCGHFELFLHELTASLASTLAARPHTRVVNPSHLHRLSPLAERRDVRSELVAGFPYSARHAAVLGSLLAALLQPAGPKKGLITDLDDTLWKGIVGEIGPAEISWDIEHGSQLHGLYQQMLRALSAQGVLLAVASKNEPGVVEEAFQRHDLVIDKSRIFPFEVHWGAKSSSVSQILREWNVGADSVVFIDDSPAELAEVAAAHPEVQCLLFPKKDPDGAFQLFETLRDLFAKETVTEEDRLRLESLRQASLRRSGSDGANPHSESFLVGADAQLHFSYTKNPDDTRPFELVNKTNQFNLNGRRVTPADWCRRLDEPSCILQVGSYSDKFGPLGRVSVLTGRLASTSLIVDTWVLSCRAFSRRIEHQCIKQLFELYPVTTIRFRFLETPKNAPLRAFLGEFVPLPIETEVELSRAAFFAKAPNLHHRVTTIQ